MTNKTKAGFPIRAARFVYYTHGVQRRLSRSKRQIYFKITFEKYFWNIASAFSFTSVVGLSVSLSG